MKTAKHFYFLVFGLLIISCIPTVTHATGDIVGFVTNSDPNAVADAAVTAILDGASKGSDITEPNGLYTITGLEEGVYKLHVLKNGYEYRIEKNVSVSNDSSTNKDITNLAFEGVITGAVTKSDETSPISNIKVIAMDPNNFTLMSTSDNNGEYAICKLPAGTYVVRGVDPNSNYVFLDEENNTVVAGQTTSNVDLIGTNGKISGTVAESDGTTKIEGAFVVAMDSNDDAKATFTDIDGYYELTGLATGSYTVTVSFDDNEIADANDVSVTDGTTTNMDFTAEGGAISGSVTNSSQDPINGAIFIAINNGKAYRALSNSYGSYKIEYLPAGNYQVLVDPNDENFVSDKINDVVVIANQETSNQNFILGSSGEISGTVTDNSYVPIEGALVFVIDSDDPNEVYIPVFSGTDGNYVIKHLRSGTYIIYVSVNGYVSDSETDVTVTVGQTTSGKDFNLSDSGGTISGTVYESDGQTPISGALVDCESEGKSWGTVLSDENGDYSLALLQSGVYNVTAYAVGYESQTLNNIVINSTEENSDNDFTLDEE